MTAPGSFTVRRSAWRMWGLSLAGVPMVVIGIDLLTQRRITNALRELLFRPDDTQLPEPRDLVWAVALLVVGLVLTSWGLRELVSPTRVIQADAAGVRLRVRGPFRPPLHVTWDQLDDVGSGTVDDEGTALPVLWVRVTDPDILPANTWGARLIDDRTLAVLAADWEVSATEAARGIAAQADAGAPPDT